MINIRTAQRVAPLRSFLAAISATGLLAAIAGGVASVALNAGWVGVVISAVTAAVVVAGSAAICLIWWRGLDEAAREAHKWAWWWGGTAGTVIGGLAFIGLLMLSGPGGRLPGDFASLTPVEAAKLAIYVILLCQVGGYGAAWAVWWLARR